MNKYLPLLIILLGFGLVGCQLGKAFDASFNSELYAYPYENNCFMLKDHRTEDRLVITYSCDAKEIGVLTAEILSLGLVSYSDPTHDVYRNIADEFLENTLPNRACKITQGKYWADIDAFEYIYQCEFPKSGSRYEGYANQEELCRRWETINYWSCDDNE